MKTNQIVYLVIVILIGGGLFAYYNQNKSNNQNQNNLSTNKVNLAITEVKENPVLETPKASLNDIAGNIIALKNEKDTTEIVSVSVKDSTLKIIYTDKDESKKIIKIVGLRNNNVVFFENESTSSDHGDLVELPINDISKKVVLQKDLPLTTNPVIQPQNDKLLISSFSQVERDFGDSLILEDLDGKNNKTIVSKIPSIEQPAFSPDGQTIFYGSEDGDKRTIQVVDLKGKILKVIPVDGSIFNLLKTKDYLYALIGPTSATNLSKAHLVVFNDKFEKIKDLTNQDGIGSNLISLNGTVISFIESIQPSLKSKSTLKIKDINTGEKKDFGSYNHLIGYTNE